MKYQNKTPEEIVRQYKRGLRLKQGLVILVVLLYLAVTLWGIWWRGEGIFDILLKILIFYLASLFINVLISWDFLSLNLILNQNCDPVTYLQVMRSLGKMHNRKRNALSIQVNEAAGLMWSGHFAEALDLVKTLVVPEKDVVNRISVLYIRFYCYMKLENQAGARQIQRETEALIPTIKRASHQKRGKELLDLMACSFALEQADYDTFRRIEEARVSTYTANIQKVGSAMKLAGVDLAQGEAKNARARLEYVVQTGGTLYMVEEARQLLAKMDQENPDTKSELKDKAW